MVPITRVPRAPVHLRGVINYRGTVIPVADLGARLGGGIAASSELGSIIVPEIIMSKDAMTLGILADAVREVIAIDPSHIMAAPSIGHRGPGEIIAGIYERSGVFIIILNIDRAFGDDGPSI
jgi:purine-binding chemotaxis protein CheW